MGGAGPGVGQPVASLTPPEGLEPPPCTAFPAPPYSLLALPRLLLLCQDWACLTVPHQLLDLPASLPGWREDEVWIDGEEIEGSFLSRSVPGLRQLVTDSQCPPPPAEAGTALAQPQCHSEMETQGSQGKDFSSHRFIRGCRCLHPFSFILYAFVHPFNSIYCALTLSQAPFWDEDAAGTSLTRLTGMGPAMGLL